MSRKSPRQLPRWRDVWCGGLSLAAVVGCSADRPVADGSGEIEITAIATLRGSGDTVDFLQHTRVSRAANGWFVAAPVAATRGTIAIYDPAGSLVKILGRIGQGPGEMGGSRGTPGFSGFGFGPGDSLIIGDMPQRRVTVFTPPPELGFARQFISDRSLFGFGVTTAGLLVFPVMASSQIMPGAKKTDPVRMVGLPARLYSWDGAMVSQFGATQSAAREDDLFGAVALADSGRLWFGDGRRYEIRLIDSAGAVVRRLTRNVAWFPPDTSQRRAVWERPPPARINSISVGPDGNLWVFITRASKDWAKHRPPRAPVLRPGMPIQMLPAITMIEFYESVIEVLDPVTGKLLGTRDLSGDFWGFVAPGYLYQQPEDSTGLFTATIWRASVKPAR